ncbi:hypothetical protein Tco_1193567 [Tanacetum coccineum]
MPFEGCCCGGGVALKGGSGGDGGGGFGVVKEGSGMEWVLTVARGGQWEGDRIDGRWRSIMEWAESPARKSFLAVVVVAGCRSLHARTKHIEVDCHYVRDQIKSGLVKPSYVSTKEQVADVFTKVLPTEQHYKLLSKLGVSVAFHSQLKGECKRGEG